MQVTILWQCLNGAASKSDSACILVGVPRVVRSKLLDLLSPIAHHHQSSFIAAVGIAWQERKGSHSPPMHKQTLPGTNSKSLNSRKNIGFILRNITDNIHA